MPLCAGVIGHTFRSGRVSIIEDVTAWPDCLEISPGVRAQDLRSRTVNRPGDWGDGVALRVWRGVEVSLQLEVSAERGDSRGHESIAGDMGV